MVPGEKTCLPQPNLYIDKKGRMESPDYLLQVEPSIRVIARLYDKKASQKKNEKLSEGNYL